MGRKPIVIGLGLLLVVAVIATVAILTGEETSDAEPRPLDPSVEPAWSTEVTAIDAPAVDVRDGLVLLPEEEGLSLRDGRSGEPRWRIESGADLPGASGVKWLDSADPPQLVSHDDDLAALVVDQRCDPCSNGDPQSASTELGVALLSGEDGHVLWRTTLVLPGRKAHDQARISELLVDDRIAVVGVTSEAETAETEVRTIAVAVDDGAVLWEVADVSPLAIAGDAVLTVGHPFTMSQTIGAGGIATGSVGALASDTGEPLWNLRDQYDRSQLVLVAGDVALVRVAGEGKRHPRGLVITADRAVVLEELGYGDLDGCATDQRQIVCPRDGDLWMFQVENGAVRTVTPEIDVTGVDAVTTDRIYVVGSRNHHSVDLGGRVIDEDLPGQFIARGDDWAIFQTSDVDAPEAYVDGYRLRQ
jgi:hypothetical protein